MIFKVFAVEFGSWFTGLGKVNAGTIGGGFGGGKGGTGGTETCNEAIGLGKADGNVFGGISRDGLRPGLLSNSSGVAVRTGESK